MINNGRKIFDDDRPLQRMETIFLFSVSAAIAVGLYCMNLVREWQLCAFLGLALISGTFIFYFLTHYEDGDTTD